MPDLFVAIPAGFAAVVAVCGLLRYVTSVRFMRDVYYDSGDTQKVREVAEALGVVAESRAPLIVMTLNLPSDAPDSPPALESVEPSSHDP